MRAIVSVVRRPRRRPSVKAAPTPLPETPLLARCSEPSVCIVVPAMASTTSATLALSSQESRETVRRLSSSGHVLVLGRADLGLARGDGRRACRTSDAEPAHRGLLPDEVHERAAEERPRDGADRAVPC